MGDLFFSVLNLLRFLHLNPEEILKQSNQKFIGRYNKMVAFAKEDFPDTPFKKIPLEEKEAYWQKAKGGGHPPQF